MAPRKSLTVRIPEARFTNPCGHTRPRLKSDLIDTLLAEEEERLHSQQVFRATAGTLKPSEISSALDNSSRSGKR